MFNLTEIDPSSWPLIAPNSTLFISFCETPWGSCFITQVDDALASLIFWDSKDLSHKTASHITTQFWPGAPIIYSPEKTVSAITALRNALAHKPFSPITLLLKGTPFQRAVWKALLALPFGATCHYSDIATRINHPKAIRAVGTAIGKNPISLLIPCHRVLPRQGGVGSYAWGSTRKAQILAHESGHF